MDILDLRIKEAHARAVAGDATETDWMLMILSRQCRELRDIKSDLRDLRAKVDNFDRIRTNAKRLAVILFGGVSITSIAVAVAIRVLTA